MSATTYPPIRRVVDRGWTWVMDRPPVGLGIALALTVVLRLPYLGGPLGSDEGGFLYVAQHWPGPGHWLYAGQWVDRPPVLVLVFKLAAVLGGSSVVVRLIALGLAWVGVVAAWWVGRFVAGRNGALVAALVTAALGSNRLIFGYGLISDAVAMTFELVSCALLLAALHPAESPVVAGRVANLGAPSRHRTSILLAGLAGTCCSLAFLSKQNALLAGVVAAVLLLARPRERWGLLVAYAVGALVPLAATAIWALLGPGLPMLFNALWTFRMQAAKVVWAYASKAVIGRESSIVLTFVATGIVVLAIQLVCGLTSRRSRLPLRTVLVAGAAYLVLSITLSLNWYSYYLLAVVPLLALSSALAASPAPGLGPRVPLFARSVAVLVVLVALGASLTGGPPRHYPPLVIGRFIHAAARPTDTVFVAYGQANVMEDTGLRADYPYSWSLPLRVEDPHLALLTRTMAGPHPPTWLAEVGHFNDWHLETPALAHVLAHRYRLADVVCGDKVWLLRDTHRHLPPTPACGRRDRRARGR